MLPGDSLEWCFQADVVLDCGATETEGVVEAVQIVVGAVTQGLPESLVEVDSLDRLWFRFTNGHWSKALSRVRLLTPMGAFTLWLRKRATSCTYEFAGES